MNCHIDALRNACWAYDHGDARAILAAAIPLFVIACEGAIINVLGRRKVLFSSTPMAAHGAAAPPPFFALCALSGFGTNGPGEAPTAALQYAPFYNGGSLESGEPLLEFVELKRDPYLEEIVIVAANNVRISRRQLITVLRNRVAAHADQRMDRGIAAVMRQEDFRPAFSVGGVDASPEVGAQLATLRQISYEIQRTVDAYCPDLCDRAAMTMPPPRDWGRNGPIKIIRDRTYLEQAIADLEKDDAVRNALVIDEARRWLVWET